jgi:hypothetical protein
MTEKPKQRKPYEASDGVFMESALMADSRHRTVILETEDDPVKAKFVDELWRRLDREAKQRREVNAS